MEIDQIHSKASFHPKPYCNAAIAGRHISSRLHEITSGDFLLIHWSQPSFPKCDPNTSNSTFPASLPTFAGRCVFKRLWHQLSAKLHLCADVHAVQWQSVPAQTWKKQMFVRLLGHEQTAHCTARNLRIRSSKGFLLAATAVLHPPHTPLEGFTLRKLYSSLSTSALDFFNTKSEVCFCYFLRVCEV